MEYLRVMYCWSIVFHKALIDDSTEALLFDGRFVESLILLCPAFNRIKGFQLSLLQICEKERSYEVESKLGMIALILQGKMIYRGNKLVSMESTSERCKSRERHGENGAENQDLA
ncbi:hypothetical protein L1987_38354 [Smallanthus sonchifolius]|uniref:Uncharacterized protein n=1 Tax=Smallanthus sonchifolius TaxID=185202 RepID=A0ACB9HIV0_9ASTR|nr:hypothetical protein L1987_38354 [Smallanthus sonchifolius]